MHYDNAFWDNALRGLKGQSVNLKPTLGFTLRVALAMTGAN